MKIFIAIFSLVVVLSLVFFFMQPSPSEPRPTADIDIDKTDIDIEAVEYFSDKMQEKFVSYVGQPIEGFSPDMFLDIFPGLTQKDFDGVEAIGGYYEIRNNAIILTENPDSIKTSADHAITPEGMETLLGALSKRFAVPAETKSDIDRILELLRK